MTPLDQLSTHIVTIYCALNRLAKLKKLGLTHTPKPRAKGYRCLSEEQKDKIKASDLSVVKLAYLFSVSTSTIYKIKFYHRKKSLGASKIR